MKAEDLMINDLVRYGSPVIVTEIMLRDRYAVIGINKHGEHEQVLDNELSPIPLTPEILEKNGFRKDDETDQWYFKSEDRLDMGLLAVGIDDGCGVGLCVMRNGAITYYCKYVHELQHYLRLIGGAEEIIL